VLPCVRACVLAVIAHGLKSAQRNECIGGGVCERSWLCDWLRHGIDDPDATITLDRLRDGLCHRLCTRLYDWLRHGIDDLDATITLDRLRDGLCHRLCTRLYDWWCHRVSHRLC
jgi:hypothetical protein